MKRIHRVLFVTIGLAICTGGSHAAELRVQVLTGDNAVALERLAAAELAAQLKRLYHIDAHVGTSRQTDATVTFLVGNPSSNPAFAPWRDIWPKLSAQGHCLKSVLEGDQQTLLVGGGSPVATYWAACEFGHRLGIRYLLYGDVDPIEPPPLDLTGIDVVLEPDLPVRTWQTIGKGPIGPESWGLAEHRRLIIQLAKQKYNRLLLSVYPWQPFVHFEYRGIAKRTGNLWFGTQYDVGGDSSGRAVFAGAPTFENPDFAGRSTYLERTEAGRSWMQGIIDTAHEVGMTVGLHYAPFQFPAEFSTLVPHPTEVEDSHGQAIEPGPSNAPIPPEIWGLTEAQLRAYIDTYPGLDAIYLEVSHPAELQSPLCTETRLFRRADGSSLELNLALDIREHSTTDLSGVREPIGTLWLADGLPEQESPATSPRAGTRPRSILFHVSMGVLPESRHDGLAHWLDRLHARAGEGIAVGCACVGDAELSSYLVSRRGFTPGLSAEQACRDLVTPICGAGTVDAIIKAHRSFAQATQVIRQAEPPIVPGILSPGTPMDYYTFVQLPNWCQPVLDHYLQAMDEMYRANSRARQGGRSFTLYLARRAEFGYQYVTCLQAVQQAGVAGRAGNGEEQVAQLEGAIDAIDSGLTALAAVTRSNSDRGVIAVLNKYGYHRLVEELASVDRSRRERGPR